MTKTASRRRPVRPVRAAAAGVLLRLRARRPRLQRQQEYARLAMTELDIRRLDARIDAVLDVLARLCESAGQPDAAREFRSAATGLPAATDPAAPGPPSEAPGPPGQPALRLVRGER